jgi:hypothetical protein
MGEVFGSKPQGREANGFGVLTKARPETKSKVMLIAARVMSDITKATPMRRLWETIRLLLECEDLASYGVILIPPGSQQYFDLLADIERRLQNRPKGRTAHREGGF